MSNTLTINGPVDITCNDMYHTLSHSSDQSLHLHLTGLARLFVRLYANGIQPENNHINADLIVSY